MKMDVHGLSKHVLMHQYMEI